MRVLITGATGFLGNNLARALVARGDSVVAMVRAGSNREALRGVDVEFVAVDYDRPNDLSMAMANVDVVVHAAALIQLGWSRLDESRKVNVDYTVRLAQAARRKGLRMIFVSSVDALGVGSRDSPGDETRLDPPNPGCSYVISKREAETAFLLEVADGLDGVIVNPGFMLGPYDWRPSSGEMMLFLYRSLIFFCPAGGCSVVDVRDVADGVISAIAHGRTGQRYILAGHNMTYFELWSMMARIMKCGGPHRLLRNWLAKTVGAFGDWLSRFTKEEIAFNSAAVQMGQAFHWYHSDKAKQELGYEFGSAEDAVADAWDWFVANGYVKGKSR